MASLQNQFNLLLKIDMTHREDVIDITLQMATISNLLLILHDYFKTLDMRREASEERAESSSILLFHNPYYMLFTASTAIDPSPALFSASKSREKSRTSLDMHSGYVEMKSKPQGLFAESTNDHSVLFLGNEASEESAKPPISMFFSNSRSDTDSGYVIMTKQKESKLVLGKISG